MSGKVIVNDLEGSQFLAFSGHDLLRWHPVCGASASLDSDGGLTFAEDRSDGYHLVQLVDDALLYRAVRVTIRGRFCQEAQGAFLLLEYGGHQIARIEFPNQAVLQGTSRFAQIKAFDHNEFQIDAEFFCHHNSFAIGTYRESTKFVGNGKPAFKLFKVEITARDTILPERFARKDHRLQLVDVGGAGGLQPAWLRHIDNISPIVFEPNPTEAKKIRRSICRVPGGMVIQAGLFNDVCIRTLNMARNMGCTSILEPNRDFLEPYRIARQFDIMRQISVECTRYDILHSSHVVPQPDAIKIDVQGCEYEVLQGFGSLLQNCLGIEVESHFYEIYKGQHLLGDIIELLSEFGFVLRHLRPVAHFDGDLVEVDARFTKCRRWVASRLGSERKKFDVLNDAWQLSGY